MKLFRLLLCILFIIVLSPIASAQSYQEDKAKADQALASGDHATAIALFQALVADYPNQVEAYNALGFAFYLGGQFDDAISTFETALKREPGNDSAKRNLILTGGRRALESSYRGGLDRIETLKRRFPGHPQLAVLDFYSGKLHYLYGFSDPAFEAWQRVARARPDSGTAIFLKAVDARQRRDADMQNRFLHEALTKTPEEEVFRLWAARHLIESGDPERAAELVTPLSDRPSLTPGVAIALSRFERMRGRTLPAFELLNKSRDVPEILLERALMTAQMGASTESIQRDVQSALDAGGEGALIVLSEEPGARVFLNGTLLGSPPLGFFPQPGTHDLRIVYEPNPSLFVRVSVPSNGMLLVQTGSRTGVELKSTPSRSQLLPL